MIKPIKMTEKEIDNYLSKISANPKQRIDRDGGGQYLDNFLKDFALYVKHKTIDDCRGILKSIKKEG
jgi:hypothetical protein